MKIEIEIEEATRGKFSSVKLCYTDTDGISRKVELHIEFLNLYDFSKDTKSIRFDFFLISSIAYGVDNLLSRDSYSVDGWTRELEVTFPVKNLSSWQGQETLFEEMLTFLTGDEWVVHFRQLETRILFREKSKRWTKLIPRYRRADVNAISLFSGGLDSLIGVIDKLETLSSSQKMLFASHFDSNSHGPNSDQETLYAYLEKQYPQKIYWVQSGITLNRYDTNGNSIAVEHSYRSRSFLFIGVAVLLFHSDVNTNELIVPENGTISLNHPLTKSRIGSLSTRTTHPYVMDKLQELLINLGLGITLFNPYTLKTKGEMVVECKNQSVLQGIYTNSVSCGKRGHNSSWDNRTGTSHCGMCMPCIYRRASLHKKGWDTQLYGVDLLNISSIDRGKDFPALFDYLMTPLPKEKIKRNLVVYGSLPISTLDSYSDVVLRSRNELIKWLSAKGNDYVKKKLGIK